MPTAKTMAIRSSKVKEWVGTLRSIAPRHPGLEQTITRKESDTAVSVPEVKKKK
jgi:hypothetical protein